MIVTSVLFVEDVTIKTEDNKKTSPIESRTFPSIFYSVENTVCRK